MLSSARPDLVLDPDPDPQHNAHLKNLRVLYFQLPTLYKLLFSNSLGSVEGPCRRM
jgi:hypothetical protein